ncbi:uncharacterized protein VTP21DRAFT_10267, partial [Calcarisporiella thermophila]|uniref:uncharacterized protein n=1 Tax=Calcarisporiella thermophila TaxID=911321 RepID=UPI0037433027
MLKRENKPHSQCQREYFQRVMADPDKAERIREQRRKRDRAYYARKKQRLQAVHYKKKMEDEENITIDPNEPLSLQPSCADIATSGTLTQDSTTISQTSMPVMDSMRLQSIFYENSETPTLSRRVSPIPNKSPELFSAYASQNELGDWEETAPAVVIDGAEENSIDADAPIKKGEKGTFLKYKTPPSIARDHRRCLYSPNWLNDEVINYFFEVFRDYLDNGANDVFIGTAVIRGLAYLPSTPASAGAERDELLTIFPHASYKRAVFINNRLGENQHWNVYYFDKQTKQARFYCTVSSTPDKADYQFYGGFLCNDLGWSMDNGWSYSQEAEASIKQTNGFDCGPLACMICVALCTGIDPGQLTMTAEKFRQFMLTVVDTGTIQTLPSLDVIRLESCKPEPASRGTLAGTDEIDPDEIANWIERGASDSLVFCNCRMFSTLDEGLLMDTFMNLRGVDCESDPVHRGRNVAKKPMPVPKDCIDISLSSFLSYLEPYLEDTHNLLIRAIVDGQDKDGKRMRLTFDEYYDINPDKIEAVADIDSFLWTGQFIPTKDDLIIYPLPSRAATLTQHNHIYVNLQMEDKNEEVRL